MAYDLNRNTALRINDVEFFDYVAANRTMPLFPYIKQRSAIVSGQQEIGEWLEFSLDAFWVRRHSVSSFAIEYGPFAYLGIDPTHQNIRQDDNSTKSWGITPALTATLPGDWSARIYGFSGKDNIDQDRHEGFNIPQSTEFVELGHNWAGFYNKSTAYGIESEGPIIRLPAGTMRASLGGGYRKNDILYFQRNPEAGIGDDSPAATPAKGAISDRFAFAEINIPLLGERQQVRGVTSLELNFAGRVDEYSNFKSDFIPKIGVRWTVTPEISLKASWGKSFKAPLLFQQFSTIGIDIAPAANYGAPAGTPADALILHTFGGNPDLKPERAKTWTAGVAFKPEAIPGLSVDVNVFDVDYTNRITQPINPIQAAWTDPKYYDLVTWNPTAGQVDAAIDHAELIHDQLSGRLISTSQPYSLAGIDLSKVIAILPNRNVNVARQTVSGLDGTIRYTTGEFTFDVSATRLLRGEREIFPGSAKIVTIGRSFFPAKTRARAGVLWQHNGFTSSTGCNYISGVTSSVDLAQEGASMVTLDQVLEYEFRSGALANTRVSLSALNIFDRAPPYSVNHASTVFQAYTPQFDPTNYSPVGRTVSLGVAKRF